jgi:hypothetical protein
VFCQQTVVPGSTVTSLGLKAKPEIAITVSPAGQVAPPGAFVVPLARVDA